MSVTPNPPRDSRQPRLRTWLTGGTITGVLAVGAPTLYVIGAVTTLGQLSAAGLDGRALFPLIPLQEHLLNGLAVVLGTIPIVGAFAVLYLVVRVSWPRDSMRTADAEPADDITPEPYAADQGGHLLARWADVAERRIWPIIAAAMLLCVAVVGPWWVGPLILFGFGCVALAYLADHRWLGGRLRREPGLPYTLGLAAAALIGSAALGYVRADPPPRVVVRLDSGRIAEGTFIAKDANVMYVASRANEYVALPIDKVERVTYREIKRGEASSLLEILGIAEKPKKATSWGG